MPCDDLEKTKQVVAAAGLGYSLLEYWIGKTQKIKSGSFLEFIINLIGKFLSGTNAIIKRRSSMFEGKELEGKLGSNGQYSVDVDSKGVVKIEVGVAQEGVAFKASVVIEEDLVVLLEKAAAKTPGTWDDAIIAKVKLALGR